MNKLCRYTTLTALWLAISWSATVASAQTLELALELGFDGSRGVFVRLEEGAVTRLMVRNPSADAAGRVMARVTLRGVTDEHSVGDLAAGGEALVDIDVDASLRPGDYEMTVQVTADVGGRAGGADTTRTLIVVPRPLPRMPVVMWGGGNVPALSDIGFTHKLIWLIDYDKVWQAGHPTAAVGEEQRHEMGAMLDDLRAHDLAGAVYLYPGRHMGRSDSLMAIYDRVDRGGDNLGGDNVCATFQRVQDFAYDVGASVALTFGDFPGLQASLIHSEIRGGTQLCFHDHDRDAYRAVSGRDIPRDAVGKGGVPYSSLPEYPADHVIPDDDPLLHYFRWFWREGDGWNRLHTQVSEGLKSTGRDDLWTFYDPAVRVPSTWGSGGDLDIISQWTYSYPDPLKIGQAADELFAMADGNTTGQQVMKMTQVIWYRTGTAPELPADEADYADWEREIPDARFITIAPDHLREALWTKLSRPIRGIMYHGWGSLVGAEHTSYRLTNPETRQVLTQLVRDVVRPLGPTLLEVPDRPTDVAVLQSFTSQIFASRGSWGWSGSWEADMHLILQWAQLQPRILFDETVVRDGLDDVEVLVMPNCDVLTESVAAEIARFQARGGIVVADENVSPRIVADILIESRKRTKRADEDKAALQTKAAALRADLDAFYTRYAESDNPDVVVRTRGYATTDYLFAINDHRTFGDYVGHHGLVMEKGVPSSAELRLRRPAGAAYDLLASRAVEMRSTDDGIAFDVQLGPGAGAVYMVVERPIEALRLEAPAQARRGGQVAVAVTIADAGGNPVHAVVPVRLDIIDAEGRTAEFSGWYGARDGTLAVQLDLAANDAPGAWTIRARELASSQTAEHTFQVLP